MAKATNYQKQELRMYEVEIKPGLSFLEAEALIAQCRNDKEQQIKNNRQSQIKNLESSGQFDRWIEDEPKPQRKRRKG